MEHDEPEVFPIEELPEELKLYLLETMDLGEQLKMSLLDRRWHERAEQAHVRGSKAKVEDVRATFRPLGAKPQVRGYHASTKSAARGLYGGSREALTSYDDQPSLRGFYLDWLPAENPGEEDLELARRNALARVPEKDGDPKVAYPVLTKDLQTENFHSDGGDGLLMDDEAKGPQLAKIYPHVYDKTTPCVPWSGWDGEPDLELPENVEFFERRARTALQVMPPDLNRLDPEFLAGIAGRAARNQAATGGKG